MSESAPNAPRGQNLLSRFIASWQDAERDPSAARRRIEQVTKRFFAKARRLLGKVPFVPDAVAMYFAMIDPATPFQVKATVAAALLYFITPFDIIPDVLPIASYGDDAAILYWTLAKVSQHVTTEHRRKAAEWLATEGYQEPEVIDVPPEA